MAKKVTLKKTMRVGVFSKFSSMNDKYNVHWGLRGNADAYNRNHKSFKTRPAATRFANSLKNKYKAKYKISYQYMT